MRLSRRRPTRRRNRRPPSRRRRISEIERHVGDTDNMTRWSFEADRLAWGPIFGLDGPVEIEFLDGGGERTISALPAAPLVVVCSSARAMARARAARRALSAGWPAVSARGNPGPKRPARPIPHCKVSTPFQRSQRGGASGVPSACIVHSPPRPNRSLLLLPAPLGGMLSYDLIIIRDLRGPARYYCS